MIKAIFLILVFCGESLFACESMNLKKTKNQKIDTSILTVKRTEGAQALVVSPDQKFVAVGCDAGEIVIFTLDTLFQEAGSNVGLTLNAHKNTVSSLCFSGNGRLLISGSRDNTIKIWEVGTWKLIHTIICDGWIDFLKASPSGESIVFVQNNPMKNRIKLASGKLMWTIDCNETEATFFCVSPDGMYLLVGFFSGVIKSFELKTLKCVSTINTNIQNLKFQYFSPDNKKLFVVGGDERLVTLEIGIWKYSVSRGTNQIYSNMYCLSGDRKYICGGDRLTSISIYEFGKSASFKTFLGHECAVSCLGLSKKYLISADVMGFIKFWKLPGCCLSEQPSTGIPSINKRCCVCQEPYLENGAMAYCFASCGHSCCKVCFQKRNFPCGIERCYELGRDEPDIPREFEDFPLPENLDTPMGDDMEDDNKNDSDEIERKGLCPFCDDDNVQSYKPIILQNTPVHDNIRHFDVSEFVCPICLEAKTDYVKFKCDEKHGCCKECYPGLKDCNVSSCPFCRKPIEVARGN